MNCPRCNSSNLNTAGTCSDCGFTKLGGPWTGMWTTTTEPGLTKREVFAAFALAGACASHNQDTVWTEKSMAEYCQRRADALLAALEKTEGK